MRIPTLLLALLTLTACDTASEDAVRLGGRYDGAATATFADGAGTVAISFDVDLDLEAPDGSGVSEGEGTIARGAVENAPAQALRGEATATTSGTRVTLSIAATQTARAARGGGLFLDGTGTLNESGDLVLTDATIRDFAYGTSSTFTITLRR
ncbi:MAG: hypothetical protein AAGJ11_08740 [Bacteroidota bacterium]